MQCGAGGHDVVDQDNVLQRGAGQGGAVHGEGAAQVFAPGGGVQARLRGGVAHPGQQVGAQREAEALRQRPRQFERLVVAAGAQAAGVQGQRDQGVRSAAVVSGIEKRLGGGCFGVRRGAAQRAAGLNFGDVGSIGH